MLLSIPTQPFSPPAAPLQRHAPATTRARQLRTALAARCGDWMARLGGAGDRHEIEPRLARDMGVAARCNHRPAGFAVDPRPLWGIGLTPQPAALPSRDPLWP